VIGITRRHVRDKIGVDLCESLNCLVRSSVYFESAFFSRPSAAGCRADLATTTRESGKAARFPSEDAAR